MKILVWNELDSAGQRAALARPQKRQDPQLQSAVREVIEGVRTFGWKGLCDLARRIDGEEPCEVAVAPIAAEARKALAAEQLDAMELAARNIRAFHEASRPVDISLETMPGLTVRQVWRPIDRVGIYVPGGLTPLFSTLLMLAIPAHTAGVENVVAVTPPRPEGGLDPVIAVAAELCGLETIWTVGGAQAIAALAFGADNFPHVDKICGPGNVWLAEAKRQVSSLPGGPAIDMLAGPSELMVIADDNADASLVAADLLSQAEHDSDAQVVLVTPSNRLAVAVGAALDAQLTDLPRASIARASLASGSTIVVADVESAIAIANRYAPEHLALAVENSESLLALVRNAGAVFAGPFAAETFGDYLAGSSHVLPTDGAARAWGGVSVHTFLKAMSVQTVTPQAAQRIAAPAAMLARMETLEAHARAADARLERAA